MLPMRAKSTTNFMNVPSCAIPSNDAWICATSATLPRWIKVKAGSVCLKSI